jgi:outer membrane receptor protein involved in Fe transport
VNSNSNFAINIYPQIAASYRLKNWLVPYVSVTGGTQLNNYEKIITENPYALPGWEVGNSRYLINLQAGIRGSINPYLSYQLNVGYNTIDDMYFFVNSEIPLINDDVAFGLFRSNFEVVYDNIKLLTFGGAISSKLGAFEALLKMQYYRYQMSEGNKAWHKPDLEFGANLRYKLTDNFIFNLDSYFRSETPVLLSGYPALTTTTPAYFNLGAMVEYRINKQLSAFVQATNLLNNNYQQYYLYYNPGMTIGAGVSIAF